MNTDSIRRAVGELEHELARAVDGKLVVDDDAGCVSVNSSWSCARSARDRSVIRSKFGHAAPVDPAVELAGVKPLEARAPRARLRAQGARARPDPDEVASCYVSHFLRDASSSIVRHSDPIDPRRARANRLGPTDSRRFACDRDRRVISFPRSSNSLSVNGLQWFEAARRWRARPVTTAFTAAPVTQSAAIVRDVLPNGLRLLTERMPHVRSVSIGVWLARGSRHEPQEQSGIAHFVEHMLFKGTATRSAEDIAQTIDSIGGQMDAFTAKEYASYYIKVLDEHLPLAVDVLADIVMSPAFSARRHRAREEGRPRRDQDGRGHAGRPRPRAVHRELLGQPSARPADPRHAETRSSR